MRALDPHLLEVVSPVRVQLASATIDLPIAHRDVEALSELADRIGKVETVRSLVWRACGPFPPDGALSATAKCVAAGTAVEVCTRAEQRAHEA